MLISFSEGDFHWTFQYNVNKPNTCTWLFELFSENHVTSKTRLSEKQDGRRRRRVFLLSETIVMIMSWKWNIYVWSYSHTDFMTKICKKATQHFHCAESKVLTIEKSVALWSANIKNNKQGPRATVPQLTSSVIH